MAPGLLDLAVTRPAGYAFTPGHYARLGLEAPDGAVVWRPYSIASAAADERLAFELTPVAGGTFTELLAAARPGDAIRVDARSFGFLTLDALAPGGTLWMLATGTGAAPFLSMLADPRTWSRHERVVLAHSVRHAAELGVERAREAARRGGADPAARLRAIPIVTREAAPGALRERLGALLEAGTLESAAGARLAADHARAMLCGNPEMIREMRARLRERGLEPGRRGVPGTLSTEGYW